MCWNCKVGEYLVYEKSDEPSISRCGLCGELEQADPAKKPAAKKAAVKPTPRSK